MAKSIKEPAAGIFIVARLVWERTRLEDSVAPIPARVLAKIGTIKACRGSVHIWPVHFNVQQGVRTDGSGVVKRDAQVDLSRAD